MLSLHVRAEYRNGNLINVHRKDIHLAVSDCIPLKALLKPDYSFCDDLLVYFKNEQANPPGSQYTWNFGDGSRRHSQQQMHLDVLAINMLIPELTGSN